MCGFGCARLSPLTEIFPEGAGILTYEHPEKSLVDPGFPCLVSGDLQSQSPRKPTVEVAMAVREGKPPTVCSGIQA